MDQLDRLTTGRQVGMTFAANDASFSLSGVTRREDLGDQLRLLATKLSHPSWDERAVERVRNVMLASYDAQDNSAIAVVNRDSGVACCTAVIRRWTAPIQGPDRRPDRRQIEGVLDPGAERGVDRGGDLRRL